MRKILILGLFFCFYLTCDLAANGATFGGLTGMFNIPSAAVLSNNEQTVSLHKYQIKYTYGILNVLELGIRTSIENVTTFEELGRNFTFNFKVRALNQKKNIIDFAGGGENTSYFICAGKTFKELNNLDLVLGSGNGRFNWFFAGISVPVDKITRIGFEYDGVDYNSGFRLIISPKMKFDLYFKGISKMFERPYLRDIINEHLVFGISFTENLSIDFGSVFK